MHVKWKSKGFYGFKKNIRDHGYWNKHCLTFIPVWVAYKTADSDPLSTACGISFSGQLCPVNCAGWEDLSNQYAECTILSIMAS